EHWHQGLEANKYPHRSIDFYPGENLATGFALLTKDPYLMMGHVAYEAKMQQTDDGETKTKRIPIAALEDHDPLTAAHLRNKPAWQYMCKQYDASQPPHARPPPPMPKPGQPAP